MAIGLASVVNEKARLWTIGRRNWQDKIKGLFGSGDRVYWFHCASLGEFEQGRPLIEMLKKEDRGIKILLTFFSPSGFEVRKDYPGVDYVMYLPADTPANAKRFIELVKPVKAIFIKYEFWYNYLIAARESGCELYIVSALFRKSQPFFRWYGTFFRNVLSRFSHLFIQDEKSGELLKSIGIENFTVCGDTRFDRVYDISRQSASLPLLERFKGDELLVMAGSSWPGEEEIIAGYLGSSDKSTKWVIAPHEIDNQHIEKLISIINEPVIRYSEIEGSSFHNARVLVIDNFGMLSSAYRYADIAIVGGGFGKGIHNILEPATWGIPVLFGPNYKRFREAHGLLSSGGGITFSNEPQFNDALDTLITDTEKRKFMGKRSSEYVNSNLGATGLIYGMLAS